MKLLSFNLLFFTIVFSTVAQNKSVFVETIKADNITKLHFNIDRQHIKIIRSKDKNIHINFVMDNKDKRISKEDFEKVNKLYSSSHKINNKTLKFDFIRKFSEINYKTILKEVTTLNYKLTTSEKANIKTYNKTPIYYNKLLTKKELFKYAVMKSGFNKFNSALVKRINPKYNRIRVLYERAFYEIQVPERLIHKMLVFTRYGNFVTALDSVRDLDLVSFSSKRIKFNKLVNSKLQCSNGKIIIGECDNVELMFTSSAESFFGEINNSTISLDDSKVYIAKVGENSTVKDSGSEVYLYDFLDNFKDFKFYGDNSEIHFFEPKKNDYALDCFGYETFLYHNGITTRVPKNTKETDLPISVFEENKVSFSKRKGVTKMFSRSTRNKKPYAGKLVFNLTNSKFHMK